MHRLGSSDWKMTSVAEAHKMDIADLALRAHLPHQDRKTVKDVIEVCVCFL